MTVVDRNRLYHKKAKPFLRWVGGKSSIIEELKKRVPDEYTGYREPFLGAGALFFKLQSYDSVLTDINPRLINTWIGIQKKPYKVIQFYREHIKYHSKEYYYKMRRLFNEYPVTPDYDGWSQDVPEDSALFLYLNRACFNSVYRENQKGEFNTGFGKDKEKLELDENNIIIAHRLLQRACIFQQDFLHIDPKKSIRICLNKGLFYYLDPPYYNQTHNYNKKPFNKESHLALKRVCEVIDMFGSYFMLSNSDCEEIREMYKDFNIEEIEAPNKVDWSPGKRKKRKELIIRNYT